MWSEIISHEKQIAQLCRALTDGRLAGAYLFTGPKGVGKRMVADAFAAALVCPSSAKRGFAACGSCPACHKVSTRSHPDVFVVEPESECASNTDDEKKKAPSENIKIEQIRELKTGLNFHPLEAEAKVIIIDHADRMTTATANSMLKLLEEPPNATHFVLISTTPHKMLATIRSRCIELKFQPISESLITRKLTEGSRMSADEARLIAKLSGGSLGAALSTDPDFIAEVMGRFRTVMKKASSADILELAEDFSHGDVARARFVLDVIVSWYRDVICHLASGDTSRLIHGEAALVSNEIGMRKAADAVSRLGSARKALDTTLNKQLMFETLLFTLTG